MIQFGIPHKHLSVCGSTNDIAREWAKNSLDPAPPGALVTADFQTQGRGQRGHQWQAEAGQSALMSYVYHVPTELNATQLGFVTALAAAEVCRTPHVSAQIKWPNDILLNDKKIAGILVEITAGIAILGVGINVSQTEFANAAGFAYAPTSLHLENGEQQTIRRVIKTVSRSLAFWEERWRQDGFMAVLERCRACLAVGVLVRQGELSAELIGLTDSGAARVRLPDGTFREWTTVN